MFISTHITSKYLNFVIKSNILDEERTCLISLPDSYNDSSEVAKKYPIIILLDGYTHFKTASGIVHFMSSSRNRNNLMPESIIIAIENIDRERDFTVTKIGGPGVAELFANGQYAHANDTM